MLRETAIEWVFHHLRTCVFRQIQKRCGISPPLVKFSLHFLYRHGRPVNHKLLDKAIQFLFGRIRFHLHGFSSRTRKENSNSSHTDKECCSYCCNTSRSRSFVAWYGPNGTILIQAWVRHLSTEIRTGEKKLYHCKFSESRRRNHMKLAATS